MKMDIVSRCCSGVTQLFQSKRLACAALIGMSCLSVVYAVLNIMLRIGAPFLFDVFEGRVLSQAADVSLGNAIYRDPAHYPAADLYTPVYTLLLGQIHRLAAPSFVWGRLLSVLASVATCGLLVAYFARLGRIRILVPVVVAALLASMSWQTQWYVVALKTDALCHLIWIAGLGLLLGYRLWHVIASAVLVAFAFYTKQTALFAVPGAFLFLFLERRRHAFLFLVVYGVSMGLFMLLFMSVAGEWMPQYIFNRMGMQSSFPVVPLMRHFFSMTSLPLMLSGAVVALCAYPALKSYRAYRLVVSLVPFLIFGSVMTAASPGGATNSMMPAYYGLCFLAGFGVLHLLDRMEGTPGLLWGLALMLAFQWDAEMPYNLSKSLGRFDREFVEIVEVLKKEDGTMYAPSHNVFTLLAGRPLFDDRVLAFYIKAWAPEADARITASVNSGQFDWLVMSVFENDMRIMTREVREQYELVLDGENWSVLRKRTSSESPPI